MESNVLDPPELHVTKKIHKGERTPPRNLVLVRIQPGVNSVTSILHAKAIAIGLGRYVRLVSIVESEATSEIPVDPVEWDLRKRSLRAQLASLAAQYNDKQCRVDYRVVDRLDPGLADSPKKYLGQPILSLQRTNSDAPWHLSAATRDLVSSCSSVLLVPECEENRRSVNYRRIVVSLDGSSRAEQALPTALALAKKHQAELILVHVAPDPILTKTGPLEVEAVALQKQVSDRNLRIARNYLARVRSRMLSEVSSIEVQVLSGNDVRRTLVDSVYSSSADLVVLTSHGASGYGDVQSGSVACFVLERSPAPVLMISCSADSRTSRLSEAPEDHQLRRPGLQPTHQ